jgi:MtN3 and saliva related transmembrane protein
VRVKSVDNMSMLSVLATIFGAIGAAAGLPQAIRIFQRKSAKDISIITYIIIAAGGIVWILYGLEIKSTAILVSCAVSGISVVMIIIGWFLYGREPSQTRTK